MKALTRRQFLTATSAAWAAAHAVAQQGTKTSPAWTGYDDMMTRFMKEQQPPGASLAVTYHGRLVYARGFGLADVEKREPVRADSLFRIASISKPFTSAAVIHLMERGKLKLSDPVFPLLRIEPYLEPNAQFDRRWRDITILQCLQHTGGWDRSKSFDPMGAGTAERVSKALSVPLPIHPRQIIRYMMGKPLETDPGKAYAYSNFGYCVLGRIIEAASGKPYHEFVTRNILAPVGIRKMQLGRNLLQNRTPLEVKYYDSKKRTGRAVSGPQLGSAVPLPYGVECLESMDANGGWIASAVDLMRFAASLDDLKKCPFLKEASIETMLAMPPGPIGQRTNGTPKTTYYSCGWETRPARGQPGKYTKWHTGLLAGTSTLMVCRQDGINWAVLFNSDANKDGKHFSTLIDPLLHKQTDEIKDWPEIDLFSKV